MPLVDDLGQELSPSELDRRKALGLIGSSALAVALGGTGVVSVTYISPNVLYEEATRFKIGKPEAIAEGSVLYLPRQKVYVVRSAEGFYALSSVCTHLGCVTRYEAEGKRIFCPCHGSRFGLSGAVEGGPAPRPLPRLQIALEGGVLVVDQKKVAPHDFVLKV